MQKLTWYNELGFFNNPFSIKPAVFHNELFGNSFAISRIAKKLEEPGIVFVSGEFGTGKTSALKKLIAEFKGGVFSGKKVIYYNCNQSDRSIDYDRLLINSGGFLRRLFGIRKKNMIILLDEMQDMNRKDLNRVKEYYDNGFFRSVVLVSKYDDLNLTEDLDYEIGSSRFKLGNMTKNEAIMMIRKRIGNLKFISDEMILKIFSKDENSRNFLKNCEDVCRVAFESGASEVSKEHVVEVLG
ncbi:MAG: AAA family ATPase [archaeon]